MHFAGLDAKKVLFNSNALQWWLGRVWCVFALWSYLTMVEHLSSRRPALPGHSGASLTQLEILGSCVISLESEMGKIFSTWLFQTAPDKVWQHLEVVWWTFQQMKERNNKDKLMCLLKGLFILFSNSKPVKGSFKKKKFYRQTLNCKIPPQNFLGHPIREDLNRKKRFRSGIARIT